MNLILISISVLKWFSSKTPGMNDLDNFNTTQWGFRSTLKMTLLLDTNGKSCVLLKSSLSLSFEKQKSKTKISNYIREKVLWTPKKFSFNPPVNGDIRQSSDTVSYQAWNTAEPFSDVFFFKSSTMLQFPVRCFLPRLFVQYLPWSCWDSRRSEKNKQQKKWFAQFTKIQIW